MFSLAEMQLIRTHCPTDYEALLKKLSIPIPDWTDGDEFSIYDDVDDKLEKKLCDLLKSTSIIDGYTKLLKIGGFSQDGSESYNQLLDMVVANKDKILDAVRKQISDYDKWQAQWGNVSPASERFDALKIEADTAKPFDSTKITSSSKLQEAWTSIKGFFSLPEKYWKYRVAYQDIDGYINDKRDVRNLLEVDGYSISIDEKELGDWIQKKSEGMRYDETKIFCLKVTKVVEYREKKIPPAPSKSDFAVDEAEKTLNILEQVNEIIKKI